MTTTMIPTTERPTERPTGRPTGRPVDRLVERLIPALGGHVTLAERAAMRVGLALILWSRDHAEREPRAARLITPHTEIEGLRLGVLRGLPVH